MLLIVPILFVYGVIAESNMDQKKDFDKQMKSGYTQNKTRREVEKYLECLKSKLLVEERGNVERADLICDKKNLNDSSRTKNISVIGTSQVFSKANAMNNTIPISSTENSIVLKSDQVKPYRRMTLEAHRRPSRQIRTGHRRRISRRGKIGISKTRPRKMNVRRRNKFEEVRQRNQIRRTQLRGRSKMTGRRKKIIPTRRNDEESDDEHSEESRQVSEKQENFRKEERSKAHGKIFYRRRGKSNSYLNTKKRINGRTFGRQRGKTTSVPKTDETSDTEFDEDTTAKKEKLQNKKRLRISGRRKGKMTSAPNIDEELDTLAEDKKEEELQQKKRVKAHGRIYGNQRRKTIPIPNTDEEYDTENTVSSIKAKEEELKNKKRQRKPSRILGHRRQKTTPIPDFDEESDAGHRRQKTTPIPDFDEESDAERLQDSSKELPRKEKHNTERTKPNQGISGRRRTNTTPSPDNDEEDDNDANIRIKSHAALDKEISKTKIANRPSSCRRLPSQGRARDHSGQPSSNSGNRRRGRTKFGRFKLQRKRPRRALDPSSSISEMRLEEPTEQNLCDLTTGCQIDLDEKRPRYPPLAFVNGELMMPKLSESKRLVTLGQDDVMELACPGQGNGFEEYKDNFIRVACISGEKLKYNGELVYYHSFRCKNVIKEAIYETAERCGGEYSESAVNLKVGWKINNRFEVVYKVCFEKSSFSTLYTNHTIKGSFIEAKSRGSSNFFKDDKYFDNLDEEMRPSTVYGKENQEEIFKKLFGEKTREYFSDTNYLSKGHLVPKADFVWKAQQDATFYYINAAPQYYQINSENWGNLEESIRELAKASGGDLQVYTGYFGTLELPDSDGERKKIFLSKDKDDTQIIPVPSIFWKVVYSLEKRQATAFIGENNPFFRENDVCEDVCNKVNGAWFKRKGKRKNKKMGYLYCCTVADAQSKILNIPSNLKEFELLTGP